MPHFHALKIDSHGKHGEKRRNCLKKAMSPFLTMFSTLYGIYFSFSMHFKMSSGICFSLDQSNLLSGYRLTLYQTKYMYYDVSILKAFADDNFIGAQIVQFLFDKIETI